MVQSMCEVHTVTAEGANGGGVCWIAFLDGSYSKHMHSAKH